MPAYNEAKVIGQVIRDIPKNILGASSQEVIVVDDNSSDNTGDVAAKAGATVLHHRLNLGAGGATITGLEYAYRHNFDVAVTLDSDGQHDPEEIKDLVAKIKGGYDLVIGSRLLIRQITDMPVYKLFGNNLLNFITFLFYRVWVTDSQSGFRAYSKRALKHCNITDMGYEFCSAIIGRIRSKNLRICEVPIKTIYTEYSKAKGQHYLNGFNIIIKLAWAKIRGGV